MLMSFIEEIGDPSILVVIYTGGAPYENNVTEIFH